MNTNEEYLKDLRRFIVAAAILLATPFYLFCGTHHVCMDGHMEHPPYSSAHVANDALWMFCFGVAAVFAWKSNFHKRTMTVILLVLLFLFRLPLGSGGGTLLLVEIPLSIVVAGFAIRSLRSAAEEFSREEKMAHLKKCTKIWTIALLLLLGIVGMLVGSVRLGKVVRQISAPVVVMSEFPFSQNIVLARGEACVFKFPDAKTLAVWCERYISRDSDLRLCYGEKPFKSPEITWISREDGSKVSGPYDSYIQSGGVTTWSGSPGHEYELYVGDKYRVTLREEGDRDGKLPIKVSIDHATRDESVKPDDSPAIE